jgi:hypothetical protein
MSTKTSHDASNVVANSSFDPESIMMYEVPAELTTTGVSFSGGSHISKKDKELIAKMYPQAQAVCQCEAPY